jgi:glyoxylase-like metal-dependent hydrolase (beta-lactamase superfamily II)
MLFRLIMAVATAVLIIATSGIFPGIALDKSTKTQIPGVYPFKLGDYTITALSDGTLPQDLHTLLSNTNRTEIDRLLQKNFLTNPIEASINAFLIDTGDRQVLVDTGAGNFFGSKLGGKLQASLKAAGYAPSEIDTILLTHIHTDHSGGLVEGDRLVFPAATLYVNKFDVDFWFDRINAARSNVDEKYFDEAAKTVKPYADAGKLRSFSGMTEILPGIAAYPTPGHTPGHSCYVVESRGEIVEFWGDIVHFASVQLPKPEITVTYDVDKDAAAAQRKKQFARAEGSRLLVAGAHLPFPGVGHLRMADEGYVWVPVDYRWREP